MGQNNNNIQFLLLLLFTPPTPQVSPPFITHLHCYVEPHDVETGEEGPIADVERHDAANGQKELRSAIALARIPMFRLHVSDQVRQATRSRQWHNRKHTNHCKACKEGSSGMEEEMATIAIKSKPLSYSPNLSISLARSLSPVSPSVSNSLSLGASSIGACEHAFFFFFFVRFLFYCPPPGASWHRESSHPRLRALFLEHTHALLAFLAPGSVPLPPPIPSLAVLLGRVFLLRSPIQSLHTPRMRELGSLTLN